MAVSLGISNHLTFSANNPAAPNTVAFWFRVPNTTNFTQLYGKGSYPQIYADGTSLDRMLADDGSGGSIYATGAFTANAWHHVALSHGSGATGAIYLDGGNKTSGTVGDAGNNALQFGFVDSFDIAEIAFWGAELTDAEIAILGLGYSPLFVRQASLQHYLPCVRAVNDVIRNVSITGSASGVTDHPRIFNRRNGRTHFAAPSNDVLASAIQTLTLTQSAALSELARSASNAILFSYSTYPPFVEVGATNTLSLVQERQYNNNAESGLVLVQEAYSPEVLRTVEQTFRLRQLVRAVAGNIASGRYRR